MPPRERFARMLLRLAGPDGSVRATQEDLGRMAGMSRAAFRRAFVALIGAGVVRTEYGSVRIVDRAALEREAEAGAAEDRVPHHARQSPRMLRRRVAGEPP